MNLDFINAAFELGGAAAALENVRTTYIAKKVVGVSKLSTFWFSSWGYFNLIYYKNLGQTLSYYAAAVIATVNLFWLFQMWYYNRER